MPAAAIIGMAFVITFLAELPDKSLFASLVLGTRYRPVQVWAGAAAAFTAQMAIAVTAGQLLTLAPHGVVQAWWRRCSWAGPPICGCFTTVRRDGAAAARQGGRPMSFWRVAGMSFGVVFLAEWGESRR